jgi:hypothetical protein
MSHQKESSVVISNVNANGYVLGASTGAVNIDGANCQHGITAISPESVHVSAGTVTGCGLKVIAGDLGPAANAAAAAFHSSDVATLHQALCDQKNESQISDDKDLQACEHLISNLVRVFRSGVSNVSTSEKDKLIAECRKEARLNAQFRDIWIDYAYGDDDKGAIIGRLRAHMAQQRSPKPLSATQIAFNELYAPHAPVSNPVSTANTSDALTANVHHHTGAITTAAIGGDATTEKCSEIKGPITTISVGGGAKTQNIAGHSGNICTVAILNKSPEYTQSFLSALEIFRAAKPPKKEQSNNLDAKVDKLTRQLDLLRADTSEVNHAVSELTEFTTAVATSSHSQHHTAEQAAFAAADNAFAEGDAISDAAFD